MFLIFGGQLFYANGGANDLLTVEEDQRTAIAKAISYVGKIAITYVPPIEDAEWDTEQFHMIEWVQVYDLQNRKFIFKSDKVPLGECDGVLAIKTVEDIE